MSRRGPLLVWLVIVWVALWEDISAANILSGVAVAGTLVTVFPVLRTERTGRLRPVAAASFLVYFWWKLIEASATVAWEVVTPRNRINEGIVAVPLHGSSPVLATVVANAISLTPGTLTLEVREEPLVLYVHVLHLRDVEAVRRDVHHLEVLAIRAFGSDEAVRSVAAEPGLPLPERTTARRDTARPGRSRGTSGRHR